MITSYFNRSDGWIGVNPCSQVTFTFNLSISEDITLYLSIKYMYIQKLILYVKFPIYFYLTE